MADEFVVHELQGSTVWAKDGERLGLVGQVHLDRATGAPEWITVALGLFESRQHFVPLAGARRDGEDIYVNYTRQAVDGSPQIDPDGALSSQEEALLTDYYQKF